MKVDPIKEVNVNKPLFSTTSQINFIYNVNRDITAIKTSNINDGIFNKSSKISSRSKRASWLNGLEGLGYRVHFHIIESKVLQLNLELIDSQLPHILAYMLYYMVKYNTLRVNDLISILNDKNPLQYNLSKGHKFYDSKVKSFLFETVVGMTDKAVWTGIDEATVGVRILDGTDGRVFYYINNKNEFRDYLVNHTKLSQTITNDDEFNSELLYEQNGKLYLKLNLQIEFI